MKEKVLRIMIVCMLIILILPIPVFARHEISAGGGGSGNNTTHTWQEDGCYNNSWTNPNTTGSRIKEVTCWSAEEHDIEVEQETVLRNDGYNPGAMFTKKTIRIKRNLHVKDLLKINLKIQYTTLRRICNKL